MTNQHKFLKVSRGFVNTVIYFRVPLENFAEAISQFATFEDDNPGESASWVSGAGLGDKPVDWADRAYVGF